MASTPFSLPMGPQNDEQAAHDAVADRTPKDSETDGANTMAVDIGGGFGVGDRSNESLAASVRVGGSKNDHDGSSSEVLREVPGE